jgi:CRISPR-associated protein Cas2
MSDEHLYLVTYDIADDKRWRAVFKLMHAYGEWLQLSVFQCRLSRARQLEMVHRLQATIANDADHVMVVDVGLAENVQPRLQSLGKRSVTAIERVPTIV